jgi:hypothetical protein
VVELFARRRAARKHVDRTTYVAQHRELLEQCRALAASANDVDAVFYRYLEDLAQPWLDPSVLSRADRDILFDLVLRCHQVEKQLGGRSFLRSLELGRAPVLLLALIIAIMSITFRDLSVWSIIRYVRDWSDTAVFHIVHSSDQERLFCVACMLILVSIYMVHRTARV